LQQWADQCNGRWQTRGIRLTLIIDNRIHTQRVVLRTRYWLMTSAASGACPSSWTTGGSEARVARTSWF
jgi:hypothetical protein